MMPFLRAATAGALVACVAAEAAFAQAEVNIFSHREPGLIAPLLKAFTAKTGIKTNVVFAGAGLNELIDAEGALRPADLPFPVDAGRMSEAKEAGLAQPVKSAALEVVPAAYRDADGHWCGLTMRACVIDAPKERMKQDTITCGELSDPRWKGKLCTRLGQHVYNTSLFATVIAHKGEAATETWLKGVKANLSRKPTGDSRGQVCDVQTGPCELALGNTYYMAAMLKNPEQKTLAGSAKIILPNAGDRGSLNQCLRRGACEACQERGRGHHIDGGPRG